MVQTGIKKILVLDYRKKYESDTERMEGEVVGSNPTFTPLC